jgi:hypothetical protein
MAVPVRKEAFANISTKNRIPRRANIQRQPDPRQPLPVALSKLVAPPGMLDEQIQPVSFEHIDRITTSHHAPLAITNARRRHAANPSIVEHAELTLVKAI